MARKSEVTTLSIYIPKSKLDRKPIERLERLGKTFDRFLISMTLGTVPV